MLLWVRHKIDITVREEKNARGVTLSMLLWSEWAKDEEKIAEEESGGGGAGGGRLIDGSCEPLMVQLGVD
ncbi:hypothetical protein QE152_g647 [Popillia japonica]|uniref:Uncharacterized protein n=1 Tax=Popillia japonica TaxID=7064 RepID=A0AAW1NJ45_POPJA